MSVTTTNFISPQDPTAPWVGYLRPGEVYSRPIFQIINDSNCPCAENENEEGFTHCSTGYDSYVCRMGKPLSDANLDHWVKTGIWSGA